MNYFKDEEFACSHCGEVNMDDDFVERLNLIRHEAGFPFVITSGYRCPEHPIEAKKDKPGAHSTGCAVDISCDGKMAYKIVELAVRHGITRVGINQKGSGRFVHLDMASGFPSPRIWSY